MHFILGAGGFAKEVALVASTVGIDIDGYLSDDVKEQGKKKPFGFVLGNIEQAASIYPGKQYFTPGIGSPVIREKLVQRALSVGWIPISLTDTKALIPPNKTLTNLRVGLGTVICRGVSVTVDIKIGDYVNVNLNCTIGHDSIIGDYVNLAPDVNVSGFVEIDDLVDVGTGAVLLPHVKIGKGATIGAGAVVTKDVPPGETWVGVPAKSLVKVNKDVHV